MPNVGPLELAVVVIIDLVIFGPKKLPELGKSMGKGIREFRSSISGEEREPAAELVEVPAATPATPVTTVGERS